MSRVLIFDNYDSFTYNLVHLTEMVTNIPIDVYRNDQLTLDDVEKYSHIILSPGPGIPEEAGLLLPLIRRYTDTKKILGVCLGHQAIAEALGGKLINLEKVYHGVATTLHIEKEAGFLFQNLPDQFKIGRYHSWVADEKTLPNMLRVTARDQSNQIMAIEHAHRPVVGVQFHPESILTEYGADLLRNFFIHKVS
jgi:anthranilate synthase component 2